MQQGLLKHINFKILTFNAQRDPRVVQRSVLTCVEVVVIISAEQLVTVVARVLYDVTVEKVTGALLGYEVDRTVQKIYCWSWTLWNFFLSSLYYV